MLGSPHPKGFVCGSWCSRCMSGSWLRPGKPYSTPVAKPPMASFPPPPTLPHAPLTPSPVPPPPPPPPPPPQQQDGSAPAAGATPQDMLSRLFSHYGATSVRPCAGGKLRNCAFVDFRDEAAANHAHSLLNRLRFLGKVLIVVRANQPNAKNAQVKHQDQSSRGVSQAPNTSSLIHKDPSSTAEPIAPKLGVDYPFPPHLENAGKDCVHKTQSGRTLPRTLRKWELRAPGCPLLLKLLQPLAEMQRKAVYIKPQVEDVDKRKSKRAKHEAIVGLAVDKSVAHEAVGVKPASLVSSELQLIKKKNPVLQIKIAPKHTHKEPPVQDTTDNELTLTNEQAEEKHFVTTEEIEKERLPPEEILSLPMFKNYTPGNPAVYYTLKIWQRKSFMVTSTMSLGLFLKAWMLQNLV